MIDKINDITIYETHLPLEGQQEGELKGNGKVLFRLLEKLIQQGEYNEKNWAGWWGSKGLDSSY